jgi:hypothetical protein
MMVGIYKINVSERLESVENFEISITHLFPMNLLKSKNQTKKLLPENKTFYY